MKPESSAPTLQSVLASLLWGLSTPSECGPCPRQQAISAHQLRFVIRHPDTEALLRDVATGVLTQLEDELAQCLQPRRPHAPNASAGPVVSPVTPRH